MFFYKMLIRKKQQAMRFQEYARPLAFGNKVNGDFIFCMTEIKLLINIVVIYLSEINAALLVSATYVPRRDQLILSGKKNRHLPNL